MMEAFEAEKCAFKGGNGPGYLGQQPSACIPIPPGMHARMSAGRKSALRSAYGSDAHVCMTEAKIK